MENITKKIYFHMEKGAQLRELEDDAAAKGFDTERIRFLGYEVEMEVAIYKDGTNKVLSIMGVDVSDKNITI